MEKNEMSTKSLGEIAYDAYGATTDHKNYQGLPMPTWENLTDKIREAWENAAAKAAEQSPAPDSWWFSNFDERQQAQIRFALLYAREFHHGANGHNDMMIIAKMADLLSAIPPTSDPGR